ncbi:MAG: ChaN family lipoprotein [Alphaproteobacteria bacterium]|nr:ChaN family lipoprotein [Alphaproteobacteria bacterium]
MLLSLLLATAHAGSCDFVGPAEVRSWEAPAVVVLGERFGETVDLKRAKVVIDTLARTAPVRVALERVHRRYQPILDRHGRGSANDSDLPYLMKWDDEQVWPWKAYAPLVTLGRSGFAVIAVGDDLGQTATGPLALPPGYLDLWRPAMGGHPVPLGMEARFAASMAAYERSLAERALLGWKETGFLVVVTGRGHVEGGMGVGWQVEQLTDVPVHALVLKAGDDPPCHRGDQLWK